MLKSSWMNSRETYQTISPMLISKKLDGHKKVLQITPVRILADPRVQPIRSATCRDRLSITAKLLKRFVQYNFSNWGFFNKL